MPPYRGYTGLYGLPAPALKAVRIYRAAAGDMVEIPPPTIRTDIVKLALTCHPTKIIRPIWRALVC